MSLFLSHGFGEGKELNAPEMGRCQHEFEVTDDCTVAAVSTTKLLSLLFSQKTKILEGLKSQPSHPNICNCPGFGFYTDFFKHHKLGIIHIVLYSQRLFKFIHLVFPLLTNPSNILDLPFEITFCLSLKP